MPRGAILAPVFAMFLLTFVVWVVLYVRRIRFLRENEIDPDDLRKPGELARITPEHVANPSDAFKNLFELPVVFYALALLLYATDRTDAVHVGAAWTFVAFRWLHSAVHCTVNVVMLRFSLYLVASIALWFMAARAAWQHFAA